MPDPNFDSLQHLCQQRMTAWPSDLPLSNHQVVQILQENLRRGRFQRFANHHSTTHPVTLADYIDRILFHITHEYARIAALEKRDRDAWQLLRDTLARRAFRRLQQFRNDAGIYSESFDLAHDACLIIYTEPYPFDIAFDAWATVILHRLILARHTRSTDALDRHAASYSPNRIQIDPEGENTMYDNLLVDRLSQAPFEKIENHAVLSQAIERLRNRAQRLVIRYTFFDEMDDTQIAQHLGKSKQAIYNLRNRALGRLREILTEMELQE